MRIIPFGSNRGSSGSTTELELRSGFRFSETIPDLHIGIDCGADAYGLRPSRHFDSLGITVAWFDPTGIPLDRWRLSDACRRMLWRAVVDADVRAA